MSNHLWSKDDVVGTNSTKPKRPAARKESESISKRSSNQNGKRVKSEVVVMSEEEIEKQLEAAEQSDESRFSDSEDDM